MIPEALENIQTNWKPIIQKNLVELSYVNKKPNPHNLESVLQREIKNFKIYPPAKTIFSAFSFFDFKALEIIIIGQDPYHGPKQANGLSFSVSDGIKIPPSLINIFKEIHNNLDIDYKLPTSGNLEYLAKQNILLLNKTLTVREGQPNSHLKYWFQFTKKIIDYILYNSENKIFLLWGNSAKTIKKNVPQEILDKHIFLESTHPSPLSANRFGWFGCNHFSKVNTILEKQNKKKIDWLNNIVDS